MYQPRPPARAPRHSRRIRELRACRHRGAAVDPRAPAALALTLPNKADSLKFAVLGDFGTGSRQQYELAAVMKRVHDAFPYELVILVGDNLYGRNGRRTSEKFEIPYKPLIDAGVKFYASLGNHDAREQRYYPLFNMDGKLYYSFKGSKQSVRFYALESTYMDPDQIVWFEKELKNSDSAWKFRTSIIPRSPPAIGTARMPGCARCSSRCSSSTTSASSSPATITSTSAPNLSRALSTSSWARADS